MSQRGITNELLEIALDFGVQSGDKSILNGKAARAFLEEIEQIKKKIQKIVDKGGLVVVAPQEALITAYDLDSYRRPRRRGS